MRIVVLTITMITLCALFAAVRGGVVAQARAAQVDVVPATQIPDSAAPDVNDGDDEDCDAAAVSQDAASCSAGGWVAQLTCCFVSGRALERWKLGTRTKCCGACFS
jgi:hypothetical protein